MNRRRHSGAREANETRGETEGVKRRYQVRFSWSSGVTSAEEVSGTDWKF